MKKTIVKPLQQQTKSLFKFKNSGTQTNKFFGDDGVATTVGDPTVATTTILTW